MQKGGHLNTCKHINREIKAIGLMEGGDCDLRAHKGMVSIGVQNGATTHGEYIRKGSAWND